MANIKMDVCRRHGLTEFALRSDGAYRCKKCASEAVSERRRKLKEELIRYKGGKCEQCGYDKCIGALEFHHLDPNEKEFQISSGNPKAIDVLKTEADKCVLLCSNCHRELHYNLMLEERMKREMEEKQNIENFEKNNSHKRLGVVNSILKEDVVEMCKTMTQKQVAQHYNISVSSVKRILKK